MKAAAGRGAPPGGRAAIPAASAPVVFRIDRMAFGGCGVARAAGKVCFVRGALPGETVEARITRSRARYDEALAGRILEPSPSRVEPGCPVFGDCGGCDFLHWAYGEQVRAKAQFVRDALRRLPGAAGRVEECEPSPRPFFTRNRMAYSAGLGPGGMVIGFHARGDPGRLTSAESCRLQSEAARGILARLRAALSALPAPEAAQVFRVEIREGAVGRSRLVHLHARRAGAAVDAAAAACEGFCDTAVASFRPRPELRAGPGSRRVLFGPGRITERMGGLEFEIGPEVFFQVHTDMAGRLFGWLREEADRMDARRIVELYAGAGALACRLAAPGRTVLGYESDPAAVTAAGRNFRVNRVEGARVRRLRVEDIRWGGLRGRADLAIVDPPRAGLSGPALRGLRELRPARLACVSCRPATLARDLAGLCGEGGYSIERIRPLDMFPQTTQVETLVTLSRRG